MDARVPDGSDDLLDIRLPDGIIIPLVDYFPGSALARVCVICMFRSLAILR